MASVLTVDGKTKRLKKGERVVEEHTAKEYYVCGKKTNKNVYELQQIYESTQAKTTKVLPEFVERIRFMVVRGILKATFSRSVDQQGELFNFVLEELLNKIVPKRDPKTKKLYTKYDSNKTNLGNYILNSCYWSAIAFQDTETYYGAMTNCGDFMEDYSKVSDKPKETEIGQFKFISSYESGNTYIPLIQKIIGGEYCEN